MKRNSSSNNYVPPPPAPSGGGTGSPRALATREKNREAVRKCRQRKRERTEELKLRAEQLAKDNVTLRMRLELGNEVAVQEKLAKGKILVKEMARLLHGLDGKLADKEKTPQKDALDVVYQQFFERHMELGPDKLSSLAFVVKRLHGLIQPDAITKAYLFILAQDDAFFNEDDDPAAGAAGAVGDSKKNWWKEFCTELDLTAEQKRQIMLRRLTGHRAKAELYYVAQRAESMSKSIVDRKYLAQSFIDLMRTFTRAQLAKFVVWVSNDACGNELLDMLWNELIETIDMEISKELIVQKEEDLQEQEIAKLLNAVRLENGRLFKTLFELYDIRDSFRNAKRIFTEDVVLIDPNNGGEYRGLDQVMRYVDKIRRAFLPKSVTVSSKITFPSANSSSSASIPANMASSPRSDDMISSPRSDTSSLDGLNSVGASGISLKFEEKSLEFAGDKATGKFHLQGYYHGKLLDEARRRLDIQVDGDEDGPKVMVDCESVVSITFAESSARIKELVISNDLMGLMQALGMKLNGSLREQARAQKAEAMVDEPLTTTTTKSASKSKTSPRNRDTGTTELDVTNIQTVNVSTGADFDNSSVAAADVSFAATMFQDEDDWDFYDEDFLIMDDFDEDPEEQQRKRQKRLMSKSSFALASNASTANLAQQLTSASEMDLRKREHIITELRSLFEMDDQDEVHRLAQRILSERCMFVDSLMGTNHRGIEECYAYVKRIRSAFPKLKVVQEVFDKEEKQPGERIRIEWLVEAAYGGKLAQAATPSAEPLVPCTLKAVLFLTMAEDAEKEGDMVTQLAMSWNASSLLRELGVQLKEHRKLGRKQSSNHA